MANSGSQWNYGSDLSSSPAEEPHFFKIIHSGVCPDRMLRIPPKFAMKYGRELLNRVFLYVPNGAVWEVELAKSGEELWLSNGWEQFTDYYTICHGHFLVFRYDGNSHFRVLIFDRSAAEIEYPPFTAQGAQDNLNLCCIKQETEETSEMDRGSTLEIKQEGNTDMLAAAEDLKLRILPKKQAGSCKQKSDAFQKTKGFKSKYPHFVIYIQPSYVDPKQTVNIPTPFGRKYLLDKPSEVLLQMSGCSGLWSAKCYCCDRRCCLSWYMFVRDNNIKAGDVCAFELIDESCKPVFNVTVFRASALV